MLGRGQRLRCHFLRDSAGSIDQMAAIEVLWPASISDPRRSARAMAFSGVSVVIEGYELKLFAVGGCSVGGSVGGGMATDRSVWGPLLLSWCLQCWAGHETFY